MKNLMLKRHKGSGFVDLLGTGMCMIILLALLTVSIQYMKVLTVQRDIENIGRQAILRLETTGNLKASDINELKGMIEAMGYTDYTIVFNSDNTAKHFGDSISISIVVRAAASELHAMGISHTFNVYMVSICKGDV